MLPDEEALAQVTLDRPISALQGDHFVFRDHSAQRTMGGGIVIDPWPPQRGRKRPQRLLALASLADKDPRQALLQFVSRDPGWVDLKRFELARNLTPAEAAELWRASDLVCVGAGDAFFGFGRQNWQSLSGRVQAVLALHHQAAPSASGLEPGRLRAALDLQLPVKVFSSAIGAMARGGTIQCDGPWLKLAGHAARLTPADQRL